MPSGRKKARSIAAANGSLPTFSTTAPTTVMPAFEYFVRVPGSKTRVVLARLRMTSSSDGGDGSK